MWVSGELEVQYQSGRKYIDRFKFTPDQKPWLYSWPNWYVKSFYPQSEDGKRKKMAELVWQPYRKSCCLIRSAPVLNLITTFCLLETRHPHQKGGSVEFLVIWLFQAGILSYTIPCNRCAASNHPTHPRVLQPPKTSTNSVLHHNSRTCLHCNY